MTQSPLDALLATFDRHIDQKAAAAQRLAASSSAGPSSLAAKRDEVRNLITGSSLSSDGASISASAKLSPLERAIYYEVEGRRHKLERKQKELEFWEAYQNGLADKPTKMPTSTSALEAQIAKKRARLTELEAEGKLRVETTRALESSAVIQRVLSTTSPAPSDGKEEEPKKESHYASTRELLDQRDDQALAFLKIFNETRAIKEERMKVKEEIRGQRTETLRLLENIKTVKADIRHRQLHPGGSRSAADSDASQDAGNAAVLQKVQQMQREINEARSKKELVKGILRGLILESGRDWTKSASTRALMLSLDDEDDASDDAFSDEEEAQEELGDEDEELDADEDEGIEDLDEE